LNSVGQHNHFITQGNYKTTCFDYKLVILNCVTRCYVHFGIYYALHSGSNDSCSGLKDHHTFSSGDPDFLFIASLCYCPFEMSVIIRSLYISPVYYLLIMIFDIIYLKPCFLVQDREYSKSTLSCRIQTTVKTKPPIGSSPSSHVTSYSLTYSTVRLLATAFRIKNSELNGSKHLDGQKQTQVGFTNFSAHLSYRLILTVR
jgi:hypothetical protein